MPRAPNYQHLPYVPDYERPLWEVCVDAVFPPIRFPDGRRFDEDYLERLWFHAFGVGGPHAGEHDRYETPRWIWAIVDARDAVVNACADYRQRVRTKWEWLSGACSSRLNPISGWLGSKIGWTTTWKPMLRRSKRLVTCGIAYEDVEGDDDIERGYYDPSRQTTPNDDRQRYPQFGFTPSPTPPTERTCLLQHASVCYGISTMGQEDDEEEEDELPIPASPPKNGRPVSVLSTSKKGVFRKLQSWGLKSKRPKVVRFTNRHNVLLFDKLPWEPTGCYKPDYSHLTEPRSDPQIEAIISMLHAVSSASRQSPPQSPYPAFPTWTAHVVPCES